jgi:fatty acid desaturase
MERAMDAQTYESYEWLLRQALYAAILVRIYMCLGYAFIALLLVVMCPSYAFISLLFVVCLLHHMKVFLQFQSDKHGYVQSLSMCLV